MTGVTIDKLNVTLAVGGIEIITATVTPDNATNKKVIWSTGNTTIATVDELGQITAKKSGSVRITATTEDGEFKAYCQVVVSESEELEGE